MFNPNFPQNSYYSNLYHPSGSYFVPTTPNHNQLNFNSALSCHNPAYFNPTTPSHSPTLIHIFRVNFFFFLSIERPKDKV